MSMLHQAALYAESYVPGLGPLLQPALAAKAQKIWHKSASSVTVSGLQRDIAHGISWLQAQPGTKVGNNRKAMCVLLYDTIKVELYDVKNVNAS